jgi:hypothetical protein
MKEFKVREEEEKSFSPVKMLCAFADLLGDSKEHKIDMKKRAIGSLAGIEFPDDFDSLPEDEKLERLNKVAEVLR